VPRVPLALGAATRCVFVPRIYGVEISGELCPYCATRLAQQFGGDFMQMPVQRVFITEAGRVGVAPTLLTIRRPRKSRTWSLGDLSKVAEYGDEGDPARLVLVGCGVRREPRLLE